MEKFDFQADRVKQAIMRHGAKLVLLQLPEGLKPHAPVVASTIQEAGAIPIISADPCYGACDLAINDAESLGVNLIVHFGHAKFIKNDPIPTLYVEARANLSVDSAVKQALPLLAGYGKIGLATTIQHLECLDEASVVLRDAGKAVVIGDSGQLGYAGQVIGCNYSNVKSIVDQVDAYLFVGGGLFHALGIALSTSKPTIIADPYDNRAFPVNAEAQKIIKQRWASIEEARRAETFGILIGLKPGQKRLEEALLMKKAAERHGKVAFLLAAREITPETLLEFPSIDAYVNTACPRISLEAAGKFSKPVLTGNEFTVVVGESSWESLLKKGLFEN